ncbi:MAG: CRISPR-associated protein Cas4 [Methanothrix sp.]|nr:CRISPR-associated protein Cas4 [Methanothrix sp.]
MITVGDVKQYLYCPKIIYFDHVLHVPKPQDIKLEAGRERHQEIAGKERRRKGAVLYDPELDQATKLFRVELESKRLGLRGVLDCLIRTESELIPVDYKLGSSSAGQAHLNHKYQLAAYALLVEECFSTTVRRGYVHYSRDRVNARIDMTDEIRMRTARTIEDVSRIVAEEIEPAGTRSSARCADCEYRRYCDRAAR